MNYGVIYSPLWAAIFKIGNGLIKPVNIKNAPK